MAMADGDRDGKGRFKPGNQASVGHGRHRSEAKRARLVAFERKCSDEEWEQLLDDVFRRAASGDQRAFDWIAERALGDVSAFDDDKPHAADEEYDYSRLSADELRQLIALNEKCLIRPEPKGDVDRTIMHCGTEMAATGTGAE